METLEKTVANLPHEPGVYIYKNEKDTIIYVGKAKDLSRRVKQYFQKQSDISVKTNLLVSEIASLETIPTTSEFEALLLEAKLIRTHLPKYNVIAKDDKSPLYIALTLTDVLPRVLFLRKTQLTQVTHSKKNVIYGPFQSAKTVRTLLRQIRSIVPYCTQKERNGKRCFYTHLGLCGPCPSEISRLPDEQKLTATKIYRNNIFRLKALLDGKISPVAQIYEKQMHEFASSMQFEQAQEIKKRLDSLYALSQHHYDPMVFLERGAGEVYESELQELLTALKEIYPQLESLTRIECFDMSQLFGSNAVGSMVVLQDGKPDNSQYRRFRIKAPKDRSDTGFMQEVLTRRFKHDGWPLPDFLLVDGGKGQVRTAQEVLAGYNLPIPFAGLAKRREELIVPMATGFKTIRLPLTGGAIRVLQRIRDEAHRFAITYHRLLRTKNFVTDSESQN